MKRGILVLEDGRSFNGLRFGAETLAEGEVVFNTSMMGYQEILTDPSYAAQMVVMTYPMIGNYGIADEDFESRKPFVAGLIVRELSRITSNWRSVHSLMSTSLRAVFPASLNSIPEHLCDTFVIKAPCVA